MPFSVIDFAKRHVFYFAEYVVFGGFHFKGYRTCVCYCRHASLWRALLTLHVTPENKLAEACLSDLLTGPLKGKKLKMQRVDAFTEQSEVDGRAKRTVKLGDRTTLELGGE